MESEPAWRAEDGSSRQKPWGFCAGAQRGSPSFPSMHASPPTMADSGAAPQSVAPQETPDPGVEAPPSAAPAETVSQEPETPGPKVPTHLPAGELAAEELEGWIAEPSRLVDLVHLEIDRTMEQGQIRALDPAGLVELRHSLRSNPPIKPVSVTVWPADMQGVSQLPCLATACWTGTPLPN